MSKVGRSKDPRRPRRVASERKAQMHFCSDAQLPRSVKTAIAVLTDRVLFVKVENAFRQKKMVYFFCQSQRKKHMDPNQELAKERHRNLTIWKEAMALVWISCGT